MLEDYRDILGQMALEDLVQVAHCEVHHPLPEDLVYSLFPDLARNSASHAVQEKTLIDEGPTTACSECPKIIPVSEAWISQGNGRALCDSCFQKAEMAGRARRGQK